jgi:integrase
MTTNPPPEAAPGPEWVGEYVSLFRRGDTWYVNFQRNKKQVRYSLRTKKKKVALRKAQKIDDELVAGTWSEAIEPATIKDGVEKYLACQVTDGRSPKTLAKYGGIFVLLQAFADEKRVRDLTGIDPAFVDAFRAQRKKAGRSEKTRYSEFVVIRQLILFALSRKLITTDPLLGYRVKKPRPTPQVCWTRDEMRLIIDAAPEDVRPVLSFLAETGERFGEMAWTTWDDVDFARNRLLVRAKDGWKPKTGDERIVPLSPELKQILGRLPRAYRWVMTMPGSNRHPGPGRQWTERRLLAELKKVLKRLNLPGKIHTFRHAFISNALLRGVPEVVVREWVGHVDPHIIRLYSHVHDNASQAAMQRLAEANGTLQKEEGSP